MLRKAGFRYYLPQCLALVHALRRGLFGSLIPSVTHQHFTSIENAPIPPVVGRTSTLSPFDSVGDAGVLTRVANGAREGSGPCRAPCDASTTAGRRRAQPSREGGRAPERKQAAAGRRRRGQPSHDHLVEAETGPPTMPGAGTSSTFLAAAATVALARAEAL